MNEVYKINSGTNKCLPSQSLALVPTQLFGSSAAAQLDSAPTSGREGDGRQSFVGRWQAQLEQQLAANSGNSSKPFGSSYSPYSSCSIGLSNSSQGANLTMRNPLIGFATAASSGLRNKAKSY